MYEGYPKETRDQAIKLFKEGGRSIAEIAKIIGTSNECARNWISIDPEIIKYKKLARRLRDLGWKPSEISKRLAVRYFPVDYRLVQGWTKMQSDGTVRERQRTEDQKTAEWCNNQLKKWPRAEGIDEHLEELID